MALRLLDAGSLHRHVTAFLLPPLLLSLRCSPSCLPAQQCSASCGKGTRMRYVSCRDNQGGVAEESACAHLPKPPAREVCSVVACGQWKVLEWTAVRHHKFICSPSSKLLLPLITWSFVQFGVELAQDLHSHSNRSASHYVGRQCR